MENATFPLPSTWQTLLNLYGFLVPFMLYAAWSTLAFWDIGRREGLSRAGAIGWIAAVLLAPFAGAAAYHLLGGSRVPGHLRAAIVGGGIAFYVLVLIVGSLVGGVT
jgi:hypothetical protein